MKVYTPHKRKKYMSNFIGALVWWWGDCEAQRILEKYAPLQAPPQKKEEKHTQKNLCL
jgi:hypothetical protein